jgi:hypothetical protein
VNIGGVEKTNRHLGPLVDFIEDSKTRCRSKGKT